MDNDITANPYYKIMNAAGQTDDEKAARIARKWNRKVFREQSRAAYEEYLDYLEDENLALASSYAVHARAGDDALRRKLDTAGLQDAQDILARLKEMQPDWEHRIEALKNGMTKSDDLRMTYLTLSMAEEMFDTPHPRMDSTEAPAEFAKDMEIQRKQFLQRTRTMLKWLDETIAHGEQRVAALREEDTQLREFFRRATFNADLDEKGMATSRKVVAPKRARFSPAQG